MNLAQARKLVLRRLSEYPSTGDELLKWKSSVGLSYRELADALRSLTVDGSIEPIIGLGSGMHTVWALKSDRVRAFSEKISRDAENSEAS